MVLHPESERIYINNPKTGMPDAEIFFPLGSDGVHSITHTVVNKELRGQGVAGLLTQAAATLIRMNGKKTRLICSYAQKWFAEHPEFSDIIFTEDDEKENAEQTNE